MSKKVLNSLPGELAPSEAPNFQSTGLNQVEGGLGIPDSNKLAKMIPDLFYQPNNNQQRLKAKFWTRFTPGPFINDFSKLTLEMVMKVTNSPSLKAWWQQPGFKEWFLNKEDEKEKLRYLFDKSLDTLEQILDNPEANVNAKVNAVKLLAEMTGNLSRKGAPEKFADQEIENMSESQLQAYLTKKGVKVVHEKVIEQKDE